MANFNSVTISENKEVSSKVNPAGDGMVGKVVPMNPSESAVDRISFSEGTTSHDTARVNSVELNNKGAEGLSSARTPYDTAITNVNDINPKSSIIFDGKQMLVSSAVQLGYLTFENGQYVEIDRNAVKAQADSQKAQEQRNVRTIDFSDDTGKANLQAMAQKGNPQLVTSFAHTLIGNIVDGRECNSIVDTFSQQIGANPASVVDAFEGMFSTQLEKAGAYIEERYGVKADEFVDYISETAPAHIRKMAMIAGYHNDLKTLDQLVKHFKQGKKF